MGELVFVGLGLGDRGISLAGRRRDQGLGPTYFERYTSPPSPTLVSGPGGRHGQEGLDRREGVRGGREGDTREGGRVEGGACRPGRPDDSDDPQRPAGEGDLARDTAPAWSTAPPSRPPRRARAGSTTTSSGGRSRSRARARRTTKTSTSASTATCSRASTRSFCSSTTWRRSRASSRASSSRGSWTPRRTSSAGSSRRGRSRSCSGGWG